MKLKCKQCGREVDQLIDGRFCSNSCKKLHIKKWRIKLKRFYKQFRKEY